MVGVENKNGFVVKLDDPDHRTTMSRIDLLTVLGQLSHA